MIAEPLGLGSGDWVVVAAYLLFSLLLGVWLTRRAGAGLDAYFVADRKLSWWLAGTSMVATSFAADTPLAIARIVRTQGLQGNWYWWSGVMAFVGCTFFFAPLWRRAGLTTDVELIEMRYEGRPAAALRTVLALHRALLVNGLTMGWVVLGMQKIAVETFGWSKSLAVPALVALSLLYTALSGLWGVVVTDVFQFVLAMVGSVALACFVMDALGGPAALASRAVETAASLELSSVPSPVAASSALVTFLPDAGAGSLALGSFLFFVTLQWWGGVEGGGFVAQRLFATKDERHAAGAMLWFTVAHFVLRTWPWIIVGLGSIVVFPQLADPESAYPKMMLRFMPPGWMGLMVASLLAAFMSTVTTHLNWGASYLVTDVWMRYRGARAGPRRQVTVARLLVVATAAIAGLAAWQMDSIFGAWLYVGELGAGGVLVGVARWYWWRVNAWSEIAALASSLLLSTALRMGPLGADDLYPIRFVIELGAGTIVWVSVTLLTRPASIERLERFYRRVRPGGLWGPVAARCPDVASNTPGRCEIAAWFCGVSAVYAALVGVGWCVMGRPANGALALCAATLASWGLVIAVRESRWLRGS